ncbi:MAG: DUF2007 domain-containing protein [Lentimicrobium sp.]|jgi:hypothetical protein|nr:DUF2007 domain-containing protein [Lentimicrobium sp.]
MEGWTCIYTTTLLHEAELIKGMLEENFITAIVVNKQDSFYLFGDIEIHVPNANAFEAIQLLKSSEGE